MLSHYFRSAIRYLFRHKLYSIIHIFGLALGIACFFLSYYHIQYEYSYDRQYHNAPYIYRVVTGDVASGDGWVRVSAPLPEKLKTDIPEIQDFARLINLDKASKTSILYQQQTFYESDFFLADPSVIDFFDLQILKGDAGALHDLNTIILSQSKADQIFGLTNPIGQILRINDEYEFTVGGVFQDFDKHSHLNMDFVVSFQNLERMLPGTSLAANWGQFNYFAYVLLHPDAIETEVEQKIQTLKVRLNEENTFGFDAINLQPLAAIHFQDNRGNLKPSYDNRNAYIYGIAALAILIISIINYINLSTAGATRRLREVGLRKTVGANQGQLIAQFIGESLILTMIAAILGLLIIRFVLLGLVNQLMDTYLQMSMTSLQEWLLLLSIIVLISAVSGSYIAYYILKVQPVKALKGQIRTASGSQPVRSVLVSLQFIFAIVLLSSALFIQSQLSLLQHQEIGLQKEGVIDIPLYEPKWQEDIELIKKELQQLPVVTAASATGFQAGTANWHQSVWWEGQMEDVSMNIINADADLFETLGLELKAGDVNYIQSDLRQELTYVLNERAAAMISEVSPVGKSFSALGPNSRKPIAGVVKDFNYKSLHHPIEPVVLVLGTRFKPRNLLVKIQSNTISEALSQISASLAKISPDVKFDYQFLDDAFNALYSQEQRTQKIVTFYTAIAILLSVLGLFGIVSFEMNERRKEMAVRKVLGITDLGMGRLISGKFLMLLILAGLIAVPMTWYLLQEWLKNFTYRISLNAGLFIMAILGIFFLIIGIMLIKWLQFRRTNLAQVLKYE